MKNFKEKIIKALRWSEKYTKTDMIYLARGGFWLTFGQGISAASSFLMAIAFANLLPKEVYGTYKFILSIAGILTIPTLHGMATAVTRAVAQGFEGTVVPAFKTKIKWGTLSALASLAVAGYYWINGNETLTFSFLIAAAFLPFMDSFGIFESYLVGKKEFGKSSRYGIIIKLISVATLITVVFLTDNVIFVILAYFIPYTFLRLIYYFYTIKSLQKTSPIQREAIGYGKNLSLMGIISTVANQIDKILLFHFLGAAELAIYAIALAPVEQVKGILKNVQLLTSPKFAEKNSVFNKALAKKILLFSGVLLLTTGIYVLAAPIVFNIFFREYPDSVRLSQVFSLSLVSVALFIPLSLMEARGLTKRLYQYKTATSIFTIIAVFSMIFYFGLIGAIIGRIIARLFNLLLAIIFAKKFT